MERIDFSLPGSKQVNRYDLLPESSKNFTRGESRFVLNNFNNEITKSYKLVEATYLAEDIVCDSEELVLSNINLGNYKTNINKALNSIKSGKLEKVVVSRQIQLQGKLNAGAVFHDLVNTHPNAFVYHLMIDGIGLIGATPEVLIKKKGSTINADALAGTISTELLEKGVGWSDKEYREHAHVTEFISEVFKKNKVIPSVSERVTKQAGAVSHLYQEITGHLRNAEAFEALVSDLHPTPAVCGIATTEAREWIMKHEPNRSFYTGYLGFISDNESQLFVNLRCLEYTAENTTLFVGGGIVEGSNFESELIETKHKAETLLSSIRKYHSIKA